MMNYCITFDLILKLDNHVSDNTCVRVQNELKKAVFRLPEKWRKNAITLASYSIKRIGSI